MESFDQWMKDCQTEWRKAHVETTEDGTWAGCSYPFLLPRDSWEEGLWPGIRSGTKNSLPEYLQASRVQKHQASHHLNSSWMLCANLYFPFRATAGGRELFALFLKRYVASEIESLQAIELEHVEDGELRPACLLGEEGGTRGANQTSPDLGLRVNECRGLVLVESKFTEHSFYECSAWRHKGSASRRGNPDPDRCKHPVEVANDPASQCHQAYWGRKYWDHLAQVVDKPALADLPHCPAMRHGYQLFRQQALAEGIARSGRYDFVVSAVAVDDRNDELDAALKRSGIDGLRQWGALFNGQARFAVFTHQEWVAWVREHDEDGEWSDWLSYVRSRYCL